MQLMKNIMALSLIVAAKTFQTIHTYDAIP